MRGAAVDGMTCVRLRYRPPLDAAALGAFFQQRRIEGVERVQRHEDGRGFTFTRTLALHAGGRRCTGWLCAQVEPSHCQVALCFSAGLRPHEQLLVQRVRDWLDLDADPHAIHQVLAADFPHGKGLRVPGTLDGFELAVRAVLGQQITVAAARTLAQRLAARFGEPIATPHAGLDRLFPDATRLVGADADALGALGIVRQRQRALQALAHAVIEDGLRLEPAGDVAATMERLTALPGIGPWTAHYIALRALRWSDAFPAADVALQKALGVRDGPHPARAAEARSEVWRPWRSYAVLRAWHGASNTPEGT